VGDLRGGGGGPGGSSGVVLGTMPLDVAGQEARTLGPTIGFLAAVLLLAGMAERDGLFAAAGMIIWSPRWPYANRSSLPAES
jgi:arsenical pump membrane protein